MKLISILGIFLLLLWGKTFYPQNIGDINFSSDTTLEIVSWNIEWFPKNDEVTINYVSSIITSLDADLLAIQEIDDINAFEQLTANLNNYEGYLESSWFAGLAYIYKPEIIEINDLYEIYTTSPYWSPFPRSPMIMDMNYKGERFIIINNHFKCCGDGILDLSNPDDEETRRFYASNLLKEYIDEYFPDENVILLGDLNDDLADDTENNIFQQIIDDPENYHFTDIDIAQGNIENWSYPNWPSHLDHILITNELFEDFENENSEIQTIKLDEYLPNGWWEYEEYVSDHRPVGLRLNMNHYQGQTETMFHKINFTNHPNPFCHATEFKFDTLGEEMVLEIYNLQGSKVFEQILSNEIHSFIWHATKNPPGLYLARLSSDNFQSLTIKIIRH